MLVDTPLRLSQNDSLPDKINRKRKNNRASIEKIMMNEQDLFISE